MLIATTPGEGHVNPMIPVAREMIRRGHEVRWYTGSFFKERIVGIGARFEPMKRSYDFSGKSREEAFPHHAGLTGVNGMITGFKEIFIDPAPDQMHDLMQVIDTEPADVLVTDETIFGAGFVRERRGIPQAWVSTSVYFFGSKDTAPFGLGLWPGSTPWTKVRNRLLRLASDHVVMRNLRRHADAVRAEAGLPRIRKGPFENIVEPPDLYLMGTVPSFEYPRSDLLPQTRFVGALKGTPDPRYRFPPWWHELDRERPLVHITQGTIANDAQRLLIPAIQGLAAQDVTVVATTGVDPRSLQLGPLPPNVHLEKFIPHDHLLPRVDVMVTNGGYGGVNRALMHGVPLVVAAATEEKHEVGQRVAWTGAGIHLRKKRISESDVRASVTRLLTEPTYRRNAGALRKEYENSGGHIQSAALIEELVLRTEGDRWGSRP
ncbi:glycosyltransferase family 1 protein (plasmid) [Nocardiopsis flavescens]|nr:glycosyltransferase family 1 protein [Nocardiopsis flavescens]